MKKDVKFIQYLIFQDKLRNFVIYIAHRIDENQHKDRDCSCEQIRMINISQSYGGAPVYFIRWNPDDYMPLQSNLPENIKNRNKLCGDLIEFIINNINILPCDNLVYIKYLYFDDWNGLDTEEWNILM